MNWLAHNLHFTFRCSQLELKPGLCTAWYIYNYLIDWVSGQYGEILHECAEVFSRAEGEGKYCTRVQCLAILTTNPVHERFIIHFFDHWRLTKISQRTSEYSEPGRYPRVSRGSHLRTACGTVCNRDQNGIKRSRPISVAIKRSNVARSRSKARWRQFTIAT